MPNPAPNISPATRPPRRRARIAAALFVLGVVLVLLWPALTKARRNAQALRSGTQLRGIGQALINYSQDNRNAYPEFGANIHRRLMDGGYLSSELILDFPPPDSGHVSYLYCPDNAGPLKAHKILMFENPVSARDGINVFYADGHVEFILSPYPATLFSGLDNVQTTDGKPFDLSAALRGN